MTIDKVKQVKYVLEALAPISRKLNAINCRQCNGYADTDWGRKQEARDTTKETKCIKEASRLAALIGLKAYHQGDPRGCSLYLIDNKTVDSRNYSGGIGV